MLRLLPTGGPPRAEYAHVRSCLDHLPATRLPGVGMPTAGGPGVPAWGACYAVERGLALATVPLDGSRRCDTGAASSGR